MSVIIDLANAIVSLLNAGSFSQAFIAERKYVPILKLEKMDALNVTVVAKTVESDLVSRESVSNDVSVDIGVQKRVDPDAAAEIDALMLLVEEIFDYLKTKNIATPRALWLSTTNEPIYAPDHLVEQHVFTSVLTVKYRTWR